MALKDEGIVEGDLVLITPTYSNTSWQGWEILGTVISHDTESCTYLCLAERAPETVLNAPQPWQFTFTERDRATLLLESWDVELL